MTLYFYFENPNNQSELLKMFSILKCAWRPNFTFFQICLLFIKSHWKLQIRRSKNFYCFFTVHSKNNYFQSDLINSKKIPKDVKFSLQAHFNIEITSNGSDRLFRLSKWKIAWWAMAHPSKSLSLSIYKYMYTHTRTRTVHIHIYMYICLCI